jgi:hypothetical protein
LAREFRLVMHDDAPRPWMGLHEVQIEGGAVAAYTEQPVSLAAADILDLMRIRDTFQAAMQLPIVKASELGHEPGGRPPLRVISG